MTPREFYNRRLEEDNTIGSVQLMEEYAKHIIEINYFDGSPTEFQECTIDQLKEIQNVTTKLVEWVNE